MTIKIHEENSPLAVTMEQAMPQLNDPKQPRVLAMPMVKLKDGALVVEMVVAVRCNIKHTSKAEVLGAVAIALDEAQKAAIANLSAQAGIDPTTTIGEGED